MSDKIMVKQDGGAAEIGSFAVPSIPRLTKGRDWVIVVVWCLLFVELSVLAFTIGHVAGRKSATPAIPLVEPMSAAERIAVAREVRRDATDEPKAEEDVQDVLDKLECRLDALEKNSP